MKLGSIFSNHESQNHFGGSEPTFFKNEIGQLRTENSRVHFMKEGQGMIHDILVLVMNGLLPTRTLHHLLM